MRLLLAEDEKSIIKGAYDNSVAKQLFSGCSF